MQPYLCKGHIHSETLLFDNHNRPLTYLRLAVTDRCNLRCSYCMPEHGLNWLSRSDLLSYEEMLRLCRLLASLGIEKVRITGGEPLVRRDMMHFLEKLVNISGLKEVGLTTNGVATAQFIPKLKELGIRSVNLSLDTLNRERFFQITRRDELPAVMETLFMLLNNDFQVRINAVVMENINDSDIVPLAEMAEIYPLDVRFIEEMPFNGGDHGSGVPYWNHTRILDMLRNRWPDMLRCADAPESTSANYQAPGMKGRLGVIAAWTRSFCGTCNRIRVTPQGMLKTCLYDGGVLSIRDLMRTGASDAELTGTLLQAFSQRPRDGWEAEKNAAEHGASMATIGG
jgi:cyclic pyranopterin phosphate synthase